MHAVQYPAPSASRISGRMSWFDRPLVDSTFGEVMIGKQGHYYMGNRGA
jgi:hypothetical protein